MFITAPFIIARTWKQPRYPSADERIRKLWYIYTMEYYSAIKRNAFESVLTRWMNTEPLTQSEVNPTVKVREAWWDAVHGVTKSRHNLATEQQQQIRMRKTHI